MHIRDAKAALRQSIRERMKRLTETDRRAENRTLSKQILKALPPAPLIACAYWPMPTEADIQMALEDMIARGDRIFLPRFRGGRLDFAEMTDPSCLIKGEFGILEPPDDSSILDPLLLDLALIPGRAFDRAGYRLGRGNGGYDMWISAMRKENTKAQFWGVGLECQLTNDVPHETHDEKMDAVITARGLLRVA